MGVLELPGVEKKVRRDHSTPVLVCWRVSSLSSSSKIETRGIGTGGTAENVWRSNDPPYHRLFRRRWTGLAVAF